MHPKIVPAAGQFHKNLWGWSTPGVNPADVDQGDWSHQGRWWTLTLLPGAHPNPPLGETSTLGCGVDAGGGPRKSVGFGEGDAAGGAGGTSHSGAQTPGQRRAAKWCSPSFAGVILPVVITLIVITLTVFSLVALYRICHKKTPGIWFAFSQQ